MATDIQFFIKESAFEEALTEHLLHNGWNDVIMNPTEEDLVKNWAKIKTPSAKKPQKSIFIRCQH